MILYLLFLSIQSMWLFHVSQTSMIAAFWRKSPNAQILYPIYGGIMPLVLLLERFVVGRIAEKGGDLITHKPSEAVANEANTLDTLKGQLCLALQEPNGFSVSSEVEVASEAGMVNEGWYIERFGLSEKEAQLESITTQMLADIRFLSTEPAVSHLAKEDIGYVSALLSPATDVDAEDVAAG